MFNDLATVQLKKALPELGLAAGEQGTVVEVFGRGQAYMVEFCNGDGETIAMPTLKGEDLELPPRSAAAA